MGADLILGRECVGIAGTHSNLLYHALQIVIQRAWRGGRARQMAGVLRSRCGERTLLCCYAVDD